jgi:ABC-type nitrate/sulfonate/bicarbonate transport system substrate-binding protein
LRQAGVDPFKDIQWVYDPVFGYRNNPAHMEMLRSGRIEAITSQPPFSVQLQREGYPMILDPNKIFPRRPGKLTVATKQMIEKRAEELKAYLPCDHSRLLVHARREPFRISEGSRSPA